MEIAGKKVVDAKRPAKIFITERDTKDGDNKNPSSCAAALAAKRDISGCLSARVHIGCVYIEHKNHWVRYLTPKGLRTEIIAFDRGGSFQPGDYVLKAPEVYASLEGRQRVRDIARRAKLSDKAYPNGRSEAQRAKDDAAMAVSRNRKKKIKVAKIKRHNVTGIRPKGAAR